MWPTAWLAQWLAVDPPPSSGFDLGELKNYGPTGLMAFAGYLFAKTAWKDLRERADRLEKEKEALHLMIIEKVIPLVATSAQALEEATNQLKEQQRENFLLREQARGRWESGDHR